MKLHKKLTQCLMVAVIAVFAVLVLPTQAEAASISDLTFTLNSDGNGYSVTGCRTSARGALEIPSTYNGKPVTTIGDSAFVRCYGLTSVTIPNSVTTIGDFAFDECVCLTSVTIGDSVTTIGDNAFSSCYSLTGVYITDIADWCQIEFENSASNPFSVGINLYVDCVLVQDLVIPDSVTSIGNYAFYGCDSLTSITIPDSVTTIGECAFYDCDSLTGIWVNENNSNYSSDARGVLFNKDKTVLVQNPNGMQGSYTIPNGVTTIGEMAFCDCEYLTSVTIPDSVTSIGDQAFYNCYSLQGFWVDENNIAFSNDDRGFLFNKNKTLLIQAPIDIVGVYTIPNSVITISEYAFYNCNLTKVIIGDSLTAINDYAFYDCNLAEVIIGDGVTTIGVSAFEKSSLTKVTIGNGVTTIGERAFAACGYKNTGLKRIDIPDSVITIGERAFSGCGGMHTVTIGDGVTTIGERAFSGCIWLSTLTLGDSVTTIGDGAFSGCGFLNSFKFPDSVTTIGKSAFADCDDLTSVTLPNSVTTIGDSAFYSCYYLTKVIIGDSVTTIGNSAFSYCPKLTRVTIGNSVTTIGDFAFDECVCLTDVHYGGTEEQWNDIRIGSSNERLIYASIHFTEHTHSYAKKVTKPTCTAKGYTTYTCECGDSYKANETKALGHSYKSGSCVRCKYKPAGAKITTQPTNAVVSSGKTAKVTVKATGTGLKYTWYYAKKGSSKFTKTTVTTASYSVKMSSSVNGRKVYCLITDAYGNSVKSATVTLYKGTPAKITTQPKSTTVANGKTGKLELKASGSSLKYQWYIKYKGAASWTKVGKSSKTYSFKMASKLNGAQAYCVVKDKYGIQVKSAVVTIKLAPQPKVTTQPKSVTQVSGKTVKFTVKASGEGLKYQWYYAKKGSNSFKKLSGAKSATYSVKVSSSVNGRKYYCLVTDKYGQTVKSSAVTLTMKTVAKITTQPKSVTVKNGKTAKVTIKAVGDGLKYTWYYLKPGTTKYVKSYITSATFSVKMAAAWKNAKVYCVIADKYGNTVKSSVATLKMK